MSADIPVKPPIHYGWLVLAASFAILFLTTGARFTIGVVFKPLMMEFGWDRSTVSLGIFINMVVYALSLIVAGIAYDRHGPRWVVTLSAILISTGFMCLSITDSLWKFILFYGILAALGMGGTTPPLFATLTSKWFDKGRGFAVSLGLAGSGLGQFLLVPFFTVVVIGYGWRVSYFLLGLMMLIVVVALALLVLRGDPEHLGLKPFGHVEDAHEDKGRTSPSLSTGSQGMDLKDAMKTYPFWLFLIVNFICGSTDFLVTTHLIPMVTDYGISPVTGGKMLAWLGLMSLVGMLTAGPLSDRIGTRIPFAFTFIFRVFLFILVLKYQTLIAFYIFACAFGFTLSMGAPLTPILLGKLYGTRHIGLLANFIVTIHHMAGGFWVFVGGLIFDHTGSYQLAFIMSAIMVFIAFICMLFIRERSQFDEI
ncbi:MAG: MFS transporter [Deltaproteobacteria bacterium]|nr:MFS transporter [Deltaproteobacteria bacterium]